MNEKGLTNQSSGDPLINRADAGGLLATPDSIAYSIGEVERHLHSYEHWFEKATAPNAEIHVADHIGEGAGPFVVDAGNDDWGAWVQILGSTDTPHQAGSVKFDPHRLLFTNAESNESYFLQIANGASGAAGLAAGTYTEAAFHPASNQIDSGPVDIQTRRIATGTKVWVRCMCPGVNTATLTFYYGIHEYEG